MSVAGRSLTHPFPDLSVRSRETEILDDQDTPPDELARVLRDLDRFNGAMLGQWPIVRWVARAIRGLPKDRAVTILDVGCGSGDLLRAIRRWARRAGRTVDLVGIDLSADTVAIARRSTPDADGIRYEAADVFRWRPDAPVDLIVSGLVTHHLPDERIVALLRWMESTARRGWLISDLQRSVVAYLFIAAMGKLTTLHPTVIHDGRISVARALTRAEWRQRIADSGIDGVTIRWMLYRYLVAHLKEPTP
ncbi:MAG: methyltransferase domain-containing protein [Gemmatimonas sp.]